MSFLVSHLAWTTTTTTAPTPCLQAQLQLLPSVVDIAVVAVVAAVVAAAAAAAVVAAAVAVAAVAAAAAIPGGTGCLGWQWHRGSTVREFRSRPSACVCVDGGRMGSWQAPSNTGMGDRTLAGSTLFRSGTCVFGSTC